MQKRFNIFIVYLSIIAIFNTAIADNVLRPKGNNKSGITKKTKADRENSLIYKLLNDDVKVNEKVTNEDIEKIKSDIHRLQSKNDKINQTEITLKQIKMLSELRKENIITEEEFNTKKKILLQRIN